MAIERVMVALTQAVTDPRGRWLLGTQRDARSELRMTTVCNGEYFDHVIDRTFLYASGQRWVVDYKTSSHEGADIESFSIASKSVIMFNWIVMQILCA